MIIMFFVMHGKTFDAIHDYLAVLMYDINHDDVTSMEIGRCLSETDAKWWNVFVHLDENADVNHIKTVLQDFDDCDTYGF